MAIQQISVFVENRKGSLAEITKVLSDAGIDLRAASVADTTDFGILRLIVSDTALALSTLQKEDCAVAVNDVVGIAVPDVPGGLSVVLRTLSDADIAVEYIYAFHTGFHNEASIVLRVGDNAKAEEILRAHGIRLLTKQDVEGK